MSEEPKRRGRPRRIEVGNLSEAPKAETAAPIEAGGSLADFIAKNEGRKLADGVVIVRVTHPEAAGDVFPGRFAGIQADNGQPSITWSDGTKD